MWWSDVAGFLGAGPLSDEDVDALLEGVKKHLRVADAEQDDYVSALIRAAAGHVESITGAPFCDREVELRTDSWASFDHIPVGPVVEVASIRFTAPGTDEPETLPDDNYLLRRRGIEASVVLSPGRRWPIIAPGTEIIAKLALGYGDNRPAELLQAVLLLVGQWFENREAVIVGNIVNDLPNGVYALLANHRRFIV